MVTGSEDLMGTMKKSPRKNWVSIPVSPETNQPTTSNHLEFSPLKQGSPPFLAVKTWPFSPLFSWLFGGSSWSSKALAPDKTSKKPGKLVDFRWKAHKTKEISRRFIY